MSFQHCCFPTSQDITEVWKPNPSHSSLSQLHTAPPTQKDNAKEYEIRIPDSYSRTNKYLSWKHFFLNIYIVEIFLNCCPESEDWTFEAMALYHTSFQFHLQWNLNEVIAWLHREISVLHCSHNLISFLLSHKGHEFSHSNKHNILGIFQCPNRKLLSSLWVATPYDAAEDLT